MLKVVKHLQFIPYYFFYILRRICKKILFMYHQAEYFDYRKKYEIAPTFRFNGMNINLYGEGRIILGEESYIGEGSSIQAHVSCMVKIGNHCSISHNVRIYTHNLDARAVISGNKLKNVDKVGSVLIGNHCWIGANVFIRENITIGDHCVIAANSLVTRDVPSHSLVMGVPAMIVKTGN